MSELKDFYMKNGYIVLEKIIPESILLNLKYTIEKIVENGEKLTESNENYEILNDLSSGKRRIERIKSPHKLDNLFLKILEISEIKNTLKLLLGENVRYQNVKLNLKSGNGGAPIEWHQDWAFYPHTNDDVLAVGVVIDDMNKENGPVMFVPGSHKGPIYDHMSNGLFCGSIPVDIAENFMKKAESMILSSGSVTFHHGRLLHASGTNNSNKQRRFLLYELMSSDAWPLAGTTTVFENWEDMNNRIIFGKQSVHPRLTDVPVRIPQPLPKNMSSIYQLQRDGDNKLFS